MHLFLYVLRDNPEMLNLLDMLGPPNYRMGLLFPQNILILPFLCVSSVSHDIDMENNDSCSVINQGFEKHCSKKKTY